MGELRGVAVSVWGEQIVLLQVILGIHFPTCRCYSFTRKCDDRLMHDSQGELRRVENADALDFYA